MLARLLRRFPAMPAAADVHTLFAARFTETKVQAERAYLYRPQAGGFERPCGWAWLLYWRPSWRAPPTAAGPLP
jgi:hypothetical protein